MRFCGRIDTSNARPDSNDLAAACLERSPWIAIESAQPSSVADAAPPMRRKCSENVCRRQNGSAQRQCATDAMRVLSAGGPGRCTVWFGAAVPWQYGWHYGRDALSTPTIRSLCPAFSVFRSRLDHRPQPRYPTNGECCRIAASWDRMLLAVLWFVRGGQLLPSHLLNKSQARVTHAGLNQLLWQLGTQLARIEALCACTVRGYVRGTIELEICSWACARSVHSMVQCRCTMAVWMALRLRRALSTYHQLTLPHPSRVHVTDGS